jgi:hypothetical protein
MEAHGGGMQDAGGAYFDASVKHWAKSSSDSLSISLALVVFMKFILAHRVTAHSQNKQYAHHAVTGIFELPM